MNSCTILKLYWALTEYLHIHNRTVAAWGGLQDRAKAAFCSCRSTVFDPSAKCMSWSNLRAQEKCKAEIQDKIKLPEKTTYGPRWVLTLTNAHPRHVPGCLRWTDAAGSGEVGPVPWDRNLLVRLIYDAWVCDIFAYNIYIYIYMLILCNCICIHVNLSIWRFVSVYTYVNISSMHNMCISICIYIYICTYTFRLTLGYV